jgi:hypothetical protein
MAMELEEMREHLGMIIEQYKSHQPDKGMSGAATSQGFLASTVKMAGRGAKSTFRFAVNCACSALTFGTTLLVWNYGKNTDGKNTNLLSRLLGRLTSLWNSPVVEFARKRPGIATAIAAGLIYFIGSAYYIVSSEIADKWHSAKAEVVIDKSMGFEDDQTEEDQK